jgi:hypothetical protein
MYFGSKSSFSDDLFTVNRWQILELSSQSYYIHFVGFAMQLKICKSADVGRSALFLYQKIERISYCLQPDPCFRALSSWQTSENVEKLLNSFAAIQRFLSIFPRNLQPSNLPSFPPAQSNSVCKNRGLIFPRKSFPWFLTGCLIVWCVKSPAN